MSIRKLYLPAILLAAIIVFINLLSNQLFHRFDLTEDKQFTLSKATRDILKNLDETVTIKAYFSKNLPPDIQQIKTEFQDLLIEYANISKGNIKYEFIDPLESPESETKAMQSGIQPVMINVREKDQVKQQKAFLGAEILKGEQKEVIPFMQPGTPMEYALSTSIKKLSVTDKPSVGIIQGHGEPALNDLQQVVANLSVLYNVQTVDLNANTDLSSFKTLALIRPTDTIPLDHLHKLDNFLSLGRNILVAINRVEGDVQNNMGNAVNTGAEEWLRRKNILIDDQFVLESPPNCGTVTVQQQQGFFRFASQLPFPYIPILKRFADHPVTKGLEAVVMQFASPVKYTGDTTQIFTPIIFTSQKSATKKAPVFFDFQKQWDNSDFPLKKITVGAILEGQIAGTTVSKMVVFSDGDFAVNQQRGQQIQGDNVSLMVNSIDFLSDDTGLIALRTKGVTARPIKELPDVKRSYVKYGNFLLPILILIIIGIIRALMRKRKRRKLFDVKYDYSMER